MFYNKQSIKYFVVVSRIGHLIFSADEEESFQITKDVIATLNLSETR
jgi:hypothetical protein